jgi:amino acid adenylation domain-containing protein/non-ribosomal peptide synthase protein (TIGR01720 family)
MLEDVYPLSPTQEGMLFHTLNDQGARVYVGQFGFRLRAALDEDAFERAWQAVVDRHPALRTGFQWEKVDAPLQVVRREARVPFVREDWRARTPAQQDEALRAYVAADRARGFDLARAPLIRLALFRTADAEYQLVWTHHHMVLDGWSLGVVYRDVLDAYQALAAGGQPPRGRGAPYRDYIAWLKGRDPAQAEAFWRQNLACFEAATPLDLGPPPAAGVPRSEYLRASLGAEETAALEWLARRARATLNIVVQGAWALLLSRCSGQEDVVFGAVFSGRPASLAGADETVGLFVNTLPVRVRVSPGTAVLPWIEALQRAHGQLLEHEHTPLSSVQRWSEVPRGQPLFESILSFQNFRAETGAVREGFGVDGVWGREADEAPLVLAVSPRGEGLEMELGFHADRMAPPRAERLMAHLVTVLRAFAAEPACALQDVPLLDAAERARLLGLGRGPAGAYPRDALVHQVIARRAAGWPDAAAVVHGDRTLTYAELEQRAERLARALRARGVGPEARVALFLDRGAELAVALLAVLKAGGAYVPVDPDYPAERIAFLLQDCGAALVLSRQALAGALPAGTADVLLVDLARAAEDGAAGAIGPITPIEADESIKADGVDPDGAAYAIYTSGSTGRPKAAVISHRSLLCYAEAMRAELGLSTSDRFLQFASPSFDVMVEEIFPAWLSGAAVVFPGADLLGDPAGLLEAVAAHGVTGFELPTAFWHEWVRSLDEEGAALPASVRFVIVGGERVLAERLRQWARLNVPLIHVFGLTETSVTSTTLHLAAGEDASASPNLPVGRPIPNVEVYVLDGRGEPVPAGVAGELFVGGDGVGRGYLGRPALTAERFVPHPHAASPGARLYRTGDRARWGEDGALEFLGRIDQQVKVRGFRIEPAEIEAVLAAHEAVAEAAVALRQTAAGQQQLVAYVTPAAGYRPGPGGLHRTRMEWWPSHGEAGYYDDLIYKAMAEDHRRNAGYLRALETVARDKVVVDVGTGAEVVLSRLALQAGARKVYAIETKEETYRQAQAFVRKLGLEDRIILVKGNGMEVQIPEPADVCVSELIGCIGGSEAAVGILNTVWRLLKPDAVQVPRRCATRIAAVQLTAELGEQPAFEEIAAYYAEKILDAQGHRDDLKLCIRNFPRSHFLSNEDVFEDLEFTAPLPDEYAREVELRMERDGRLDGFLMWIQLYMLDEVDVDSLEHECCWLPVYFPAFGPGVQVSEGDVLRARCIVTLAENGVHPDYRVEGVLHRVDGRQEPFRYDSYWRRRPEQPNALHRRLVRPDRVSVLPRGEGASVPHVSVHDLKEHVRRRLPEYMVPAAVVVLDTLPLSPNGKLDRRALPDPAPASAAAGGDAPQAPRTETEATLARIWSEVLKVETVGIHDDFFELGGDSILSIQVVARARRAGLQLRPRQIFLNPTIARVSEVVVAVSAGPAAGAATGPAPLLPIQRAFFAQEIPERHHWNMALLLELSRPVQSVALEAALRAVLDHHDALRFRYSHGPEGWTQTYGPAGEPPAFERVDLSWIPEWELAGEIERRSAEAQRGLNLEGGPVIRALLLEPGNGRPSRLLLAVHHLVMDGVSWRILLEDLQAAYERLEAGRPVELPARTTTYGRFAARLAAHAAAGGFDGEAAYWAAPERQGAGGVPVDFADGATHNTAGGARSLSLVMDEDETRALLQDVPAAFRTGPNDLLLAALARALAPWAGRGRLLVDVEGHGREELFDDVDLTRTVGWFTTVYPVLLDVSGAAGPVDALLAVKDQLRAVPGSGIGYGALRWCAADEDVRRRLAALPAAGVRFEYLGRFDGGAEGEGLFRRAAEKAGPGMAPSAPRSHLLEVTAAVVEGRLELSWTYGEGVHRRETVQALLDAHAAELRALAAEARGGRRRAWAAADFPLAGVDEATLRAVLGDAADVEDVFPPAPVAEGMLFEARLAPGEGVYVAQLAFDLEGPLDEDALARAWNGVLERHAALRSTFPGDAVGRPLQVVRCGVRVPVRTEDWSGAGEAGFEARLAEYLRDDRARGFDTAAAPLMRLALFRAGPDRAVMVWSFMQLLLDGWSLPVVFREVMALYDSHVAGHAPSLPPAPAYREYAAWLARRDPAGDERFWRGELEGFAAPTPLGVDRSAAEAAGPAYGTLQAVLSPADTARLQGAARAHGLTLSTLVQGAWALLLSRYAGEREVVFGVTVSGRPADLPGVEEMVGVFINTLPVRVDVDASAPVAAWLGAVQRRQAEMREHEHTPLVQVQGWSGVPRGQPLFDSFYVFENYPFEEVPGADGRALRVRQRAALEQSSYPLSLTALPGAAGLRLQLEHERRRVDDGAAARALAHLQVLLEGMAADPGRPVGTVEILPPAERRLVLETWNDTRRDTPSYERCIHHLLVEQAARTPDAVAVVWEGTPLTYAELDARTNQLARHLRGLGVGPEVRVGVFVERSLEMVVACMAVLKAGGAYLPLDPVYPVDRLAYMLDDAEVAVVLTQERLRERLPAGAARAVCLDSGWDAVAAHSAEPFDGGALPASLAYVIYTSGSTGRPKGVLVAHRSLVNQQLAWERAYALRERSHCHLQMANLSFDVCTGDMVRALATGARLVICPRETLLQPEALYALMLREGVDTAEFVPAVMRTLVEHLKATGQRLDFMRMLACSSDAWYVREQDEFRAICGPDTLLVNSYGLTEAAVDSTWYAAGNDGARGADALVPIGRPFDNSRVYVLDRAGRPVPVGVTGELYVGGPGLARGYLGQPALTAGKFVPDPFGGAGGRLYHTGDRARWLPDGNVEFLGRADFQVKIRGFRIEPGEVESVLGEHPAVVGAVVLARTDERGARRLVAYAAVPGGGAAAGELRAWLAGRLPDYMVPSAFVLLERFPLSPNGKVDRRALPDPAAGAEDEGYVPPRTLTEEILAGLWADVLGVERVGAQDSFFELGGHSLLVTRVVSRVRQAFGAELPLRAVFEAPTLAGLAARVDALRAGAGEVAPPLVPVPRDRPLPLSFAQQRLWFLDQLEPGSPAYNIPEALRLRGPLEEEALRRALDEVVRRHEVLRTVFRADEGRAVQQVLPPRPLPLARVDLRGLGAADRERQARRLARVEAARPFDLARGPLLRAVLLRLADDEAVGLLTLHHIVSDGWSSDLMVRELSVLYEAFSRGLPSPLPELPVQYADYAMWQREWLRGEALERQTAYWRAKLAGAPALLDLPTDRPRPPVAGTRGGIRSFALSAELSERLRELSRREGVTLFMTLLAAFQALLGRISGAQDVSVGTPVAGRGALETEGLIGLFVNTLVLRTDLSGDPSFRALLARVRETALGAFAHQDLPFEKLVDEMGVERTLAHTPLFQVMLVMQNAGDGRLALGGVQAEPFATGTATANFDLTLEVQDRPGALYGTLDFRAEIFDGETAERILLWLTRLLEAAAAAPELALSRLPILGAAERELVVTEWNRTDARFDGPAFVHQWIEAQAARTPDAPALTFEGATLAYAEVNARANRLAHALRARGVGPEVRVGVCAERSPELVVAILAVLKAGGAYVPLDPAYPAERLAWMAGDAALAVLLAQPGTAGRIPPLPGVQAVLLEADPFPGEPADEPPATPQGEGAAYVIYTSGSTGRPKGVVNTHGGIRNRLLWMQAEYALGTDDVVLQKTPFSFDVSVWELLWPLMVGARMVVARPEGHRDPDYLAGLIEGEGVTTLHFVPSMLAAFLDGAGAERCASLRRVFCSGEALSREVSERAMERLPGAGLHNLYGPTEAAVDVSYWACAPGARRVPIGRPVANTRLYVLDAALAPVPPRVAGELCIGGVQVARGYLGRPGLTAERFVPDPFTPGGRLYRTGDRARWTADGVLEYLGRTDFQVKLRGFRVEPGEVEAALEEHPGVRQAVVVLREDVPGAPRLVAYVVPREGGASGLADDARAHLERRLPEYMVPGALVIADGIPLTPSGKVDRRALPAPAPEAARAFVAPRTPAEEAVARGWSAVLGGAAVGAHDNFFALGGDSILSIQVVARLRRAGWRITARDLFEHPTVAALARVMVADGGAQGAAETEGEAGEVPLTPIQAWFFAAQPDDARHFNLPVLLELREGVEVDALRRALDAVAAHHEALRARFRRDGEGWRPAPPAPAGPVPFDRVDLSGLDADARAAALEAAAGDVQAGMDLEHGPLFRAALFQAAGGWARLFLAVHHLVVDGVSWRVLLEDLAAAYDAARRGDAIELPPATAPFAAWARVLARHAAAGGFDGELPYWAARGRRGARPLPADFVSADDPAGDAGEVSAALDAEWTRGLLKEVPAAFRARMDDALLCALAATLGAWTGEDRVWVDVEGHGRDDRFGIDTSRAVGWFTTLYPVLLEVERGADEGAALRAVKEQLRAVPGRGLGFGALRWLGGAGARRTLAALPRPEILFNYLGQVGGGASGDARFAFAGERTGAVQSPRARRTHALEVNAVVEDGALRVVWTYGRGRFRRETIEALARGFTDRLRALVAHCREAGAGGCTPSDFPLARLDAAGLQALVGAGQGVEDVYPLTPLQEGMLFHTRADAGGGAYVGRFAFELRGALDEGAFADAWRAVMDRHPVLRTRFAWEGLPAPLQVVERRAPLPLHREDWSGLSPADGEARWEAFVRADLARGVDVREAPPMRLALVRTGADAWRVLWTHHHLLLDGWSLVRVYADLLALYAARAAGAAPALDDAPPPYRRYVEWLAGRDAGQAEAFWREALAGFTAATPLGIDRPAASPAPAAYAGAEVELPADATAALAAFARAHGLTLNTVLQGAWALLLSRLSGEEDVVFGTTLAGRPPELPGAEEMVGLFINTLPVRVRAVPDATVAEWLRGIQAWAAAAREHEHTPLVEVQRWSGVPAGEPLFESLLVFENVPVAGVPGGAGAPGIRVAELPMPGIATNYPLSLTVSPGATLRVQATCDARRVDPADVRRMLGHFAGVLEALAEDGERPLAEVPLMRDAELRAVLEASRGTAAEVAWTGGIHRAFEAQARRAPDAVALVHGAARVTYGELDAHANRLANHLRARGVAPEARVAVLLERGPAAVASMLAILKAGGVYVPLDASYPAGRLAYMLEDCGARLVLTESRLLGRLPELDVERVLLDGDAPRIAAESATPPAVQAAPEGLAYVVYTSGSTGQPKGVLTPHGGVVNYLAFLAAEYGVGAGDTVLQLASLSFDASIRDILGPLSFGARLVLPSAEEAADPARLLALARAHGVTAMMAAVPSTLRGMLAAAEDAAEPTLRLLLASGEGLPLEDCRRAWEVFGAGVRIVNQWGATECTMSSTLHVVEGDERGPFAPIGRPGLNARVHVLDGALRPVPAGVAGEAYIATPGVARGYGGRPALTAERFLPDPFSGEPGARMYRVGDRVRRRADGVLEYLGRVDEQVKVQGVRVEPGEVEAALRSHPAVDAAAVVAWEDGAGEHRLAAYVVAKDEVPEAALRAHLAGLLPAALIPARFIPIGRIPLLPNGKLDRRALPAPDAENGEQGGYVAPRTPLEELLAAIWADVLGAERVGAEDDFFALGGHSLLAMRVAARVREALGVELPLRALFEDATVARLGARIEALRAEGGDAVPPLVPVPRDAPLPLSFQQQRLWLAHQMEPGSVAYNMPTALRLRGALDVEALRRALDGVVRRHEVLRTRFAAEGDGAVQVAEAGTRIALPLLELDALAPDAREGEVRRLALAEAARPFDLGRAPLLRASLARLAADEHVLLLTLHHVAADGWSLDVLTREVSALYGAFREGRPDPLAPLPAQYGDYAAWQRGWLQGDALERELGWWREQLAGAPAAVSLPTDFPHPELPADEAGVAERALHPGTAAALEALARRESATPYMALAGALAVLLYRYSGEDDLVLGVPSANRTRPEVQGLIGFFVDMLPLRVRLAGNPTFRTLVRQVREAALGAYSHAEIPFEVLVKACGGERVAGRRPLVQVGLELERAAADAGLEEVEVSTVALHTRRAKFDLEVRVVEDGRGGWLGRLYYDASLFLPATGARLLDDFAAVLEQAAADPELRVLDLALAGEALSAPAATAAEADFDL